MLWAQSSLSLHISIRIAMDMATWRNGSAFGFDRRRHQKVAGSSPAVVTYFLFYLSAIARDGSP